MSGGAGRRAAKQIIIDATKGTVLVRVDHGYFNLGIASRYRIVERNLFNELL